MKIYISADIEGVTGISSWEETRKTSPEYLYFARQMSAEVNAACRGANKAGAETIYVKDAHGTARNIVPGSLPENVKLIRGWSGHPFKMMQELDESFDAVVFIGYHAKAGSDDNPLAHTINSTVVEKIRINGQLVSEFIINSLTAAYVGVPVVFVSGDKGLTEEINSFNKHIKTIAVNEGVGNSSISINPVRSLKLIEEGVKWALEGDISACSVALPAHFSLEIHYKLHTNAFKNSFYPGAKQISPKAVKIESDDYLDILKALLLLI